MKTSARILLVAAAFAAGLVASPCFGFEQVLRVRDGKIIDFKQMMEEIKGTDLVFVGEIHDNLKHRKAQLNVIKALVESKTPPAIGLEMIRATSQKELDKWVEGSMALGTFIAVFHDNWRIPWPWYMNIFKYARQYQLPMIGLNIASEITEKVSRTGFESLTVSDRKQLPPDIFIDIDDQHETRIKKIYDGHNQDNKSFSNFCAAQIVWDKTMAYNLIKFAEKNPGKAVVVLAGIEHAAARGIPYQVKRQSKYNCKIILPELTGQIERSTATAADADYLLLE